MNAYLSALLKAAVDFLDIFSSAKRRKRRSRAGLEKRKAGMDGKGNSSVNSATREVLSRCVKEAMKERHDKNAFQNTRKAPLSQYLLLNWGNKQLGQRFGVGIEISLFSKKPSARLICKRWFTHFLEEVSNNYAHETVSKILLISSLIVQSLRSKNSVFSTYTTPEYRPRTNRNVSMNHLCIAFKTFGI